MPKAQEWLDKKYPHETRENITKNIKGEKLQGSLKLENFTNLEGFSCCSCSKITYLEVINCPNLKFINCGSNKLTELNLTGCPNLKILNCPNNLLTNLDLSQNTELEELYIYNNNFSQQNLSFISHLVNLKRLELGNFEFERIKKSVYNRFFGSLEFCQNLTKLCHLNITNTDIDSGCEYLPETVKEFSCLVNWKRKEAKVKNISNLFADEEGILETDEWERVKNFSAKLQTIKKQAKARARKLLAQELTQKEQEIKQLQGENSALKEKVSELEETLTIERETNQASAEAMDKFYRQNPPREDLTLQNILEETSADHLKLNQENQNLKQKIQDLNSVLELTKQLTELQLQELEERVEIPPKK